MKFRRELRFVCLAGLAFLNSSPAARALIVFNDGKDRIHVTATAGVAYDSNIFANSIGDNSDTIYTAAFLAEYSRRAGWIGVDASVALAASRFASNEEE